MICSGYQQAPAPRLGPNKPQDCRHRKLFAFLMSSLSSSCQAHHGTHSTPCCSQAHTNVDVIVNLEEFRALLASRLPLVFAGASVAEAALPWPSPD
jgi:hypothetical protein